MLEARRFKIWDPSKPKPKDAPIPPKKQGRLAIYLLVDPHDWTARYAGVTNDPDKRLGEHLQCKQANPRMRQWIRDLLALGHKPLMFVVERPGQDKWQLAERRWIKWLRHRGGDCYNIAAGGMPWWKSVQPIKRRVHPHNRICSNKAKRPNLVGQIDNMGVYRRDVHKKNKSRARKAMAGQRHESIPNERAPDRPPPDKPPVPGTAAWLSALNRGQQIENDRRKAKA